MKKVNKKIELPKGKFCYCTGNCSCCVYYEPGNKNSKGQGYCNYYGSYYFPSERQGCRSHKCEN